MLDNSRISSLKEEAYEKLDEVRKNYMLTPREDPNIEWIRLKFTMILCNIHVLRAFNKWRNVDKIRFQRKFNDYKESLISMYNKRALDSHINVKVVRQRLLDKNK